MIRPSNIQGITEDKTLQEDLLTIKQDVQGASDAASSLVTSVSEVQTEVDNLKLGSPTLTAVEAEVTAARNGSENLDARLSMMANNDILKSAMRISLNEEIQYDTRGNINKVIYTGDLVWTEEYIYEEDDVNGDLLKREELYVDDVLVGFKDYTYETIADGSKRITNIASTDAKAILVASDSVIVQEFVSKFNQIMALDLDNRINHVEQEILTGNYQGAEIIAKVNDILPRLGTVEGAAFDSVDEIINLPKLTDDIEALKLVTQTSKSDHVFIVVADQVDYVLPSTVDNDIEVMVDGIHLTNTVDYSIGQDHRTMTLITPLLIGAKVYCSYY